MSAAAISILAGASLISVQTLIVGVSGLLAVGALAAVMLRSGSGSAKRASPPGEDAVWREIIDALPDPAVMLDPAGRVLQHNRSSVDLFPRIRVGVELTAISRAPELIEAIDRAGSEPGPHSIGFVERVPVERNVDVIVTPLRAARVAGRAPALLLLFRDTTEQERLDRMRQDFVANASHELRTPLASLRGFIETLQGPARDDPAARERFLAIMADQATRMTRLIDDLLSLSRIEIRQHVPPRGVVDLGEVASHVAQSLERLAAEANATVRLSLSGPAFIRGERDEIVQAVSNLVQNAIKYGKSGGVVTISIERRPSASGTSRLAMAVEDDGPGIPAQHLPRLTERFYRVSTTASREKGGTGLGLAIVKHIVVRHRGELSISSTLGSGSRFEIAFDEMARAD